MYEVIRYEKLQPIETLSRNSLQRSLAQRLLFLFLSSPFELKKTRRRCNCNHLNTFSALRSGSIKPHGREYETGALRSREVVVLTEQFCINSRSVLGIFFSSPFRTTSSSLDPLRFFKLLFLSSCCTLFMQSLPFEMHHLRISEKSSDAFDNICSRRVFRMSFLQRARGLETLITGSPVSSFHFYFLKSFLTQCVAGFSS